MKFSHTFHTPDNPMICERCSAPIANVFVAIDDGGQEHYFGSTCINAACKGARVISEAEKDARDRATARRNAIEKHQNLLTTYVAPSGECPF